MKDISNESATHYRNLQPEAVFADWLHAVSELQLNYHRLTSYASVYDQHRLQPQTAPSWAGQCPIRQVTALLNRICRELETLLQQMDQFDSKVTPENYRRLAGHTRLINRLNQQAQTLLKLADIPAC
ncbi:hypothetical protein [Spirosoma koreense]